MILQTSHRVSLDTISHNCVVRTPHIYVRDLLKRASYMFIYLYFKVKIVLKPPVLVLNLAKVYERVILPVSLVFVMRAAVEKLSHQCRYSF